jgi:N-acylneuraminate cytidylyltransferase
MKGSFNYKKYEDNLDNRLTKSVNIMELIEDNYYDYLEIYQHEDTIIDVSNGKCDLNMIVGVSRMEEVFPTMLHNLQHAYKANAQTGGLNVKITIVEQDDKPQYQMRCNELGFDYIFLPMSISKTKGYYSTSLMYNVGYLFTQNANWYIFQCADLLVEEKFFNVLKDSYLPKNPTCMQCFKGKRVLRVIPEAKINVINRKGLINDEITARHNIGRGGAPGGSILVRRDIFERVGGYDPELFFSHTLEDAFMWEKLEFGTKTSMLMANESPLEQFHIETTKKIPLEIRNPFLETHRSRLAMFYEGDIEFRSKYVDKKSENFIEESMKISKLFKTKKRDLKTVAIILARGGSKGIPNKNIINFCGEPLISWSIKQALGSSFIDDVYVSSDDNQILEISKRYGANTIIRPDDLSKDDSTSESALKHAIDEISREDNIENVVFLQPTSPIRSIMDINKAVETFKNGSYDSLFSACEVEDYFTWKKDGEELVSESYNYVSRKNRQNIEKKYLENGSIYVFKPDVLTSLNNRLGGKIGVYSMDKTKQYEIDSPEDIEICEYFFRKDNEFSAGDMFDSEIRSITKRILDENKFPDYDEIHTDTLAELIDRLIIVHIRYWYLEDAMSDAKGVEELAALRLKSEVLFKEKRPMLIKMFDKIMVKILKGEIVYDPINLKHYKNWGENKK